MTLPTPFAFPADVIQRQHGPTGYANYQEYKDWLRDEFEFRCAYCLEREMWYPNRQGAFAVEHVLPQVRYPALIRDYDNLIYACLRCNSLKQDLETLDPSRVALRDHLDFEPDGSVVARTVQGRKFIRLFRLDLVPAIEVRYQQLTILRLKSAHPDDANVDQLFRLAFGYPEDLPDLRTKRPESNSRPAGIRECHFVRRLEGRLPEVY